MKKRVTFHQAVQDILLNVLKEFGIDAKKEYLNIDIIARKGRKIITIEIETSGTKDKIKKNCEKCLFINPTKHIHILIDKDANTEITRFKEILNYKNVKVLTYKIRERWSKQKPVLSKEEILKILKEIEEKRIPTKSKINLFKKTTGRSRATYFRYKSLFKKLKLP